MRGTVAAVLLLLALSGLLFFIRLGTPGLTDRDEASFSEATREMIETGDWVTPRLNGADRFDKPILVYYLMAGSFAVFGVNEFAARFHSAVSATILLVITFLFLRRHVSERAALLAALILGTNLQIAILGRAAITDMALVLTTTGALFAFFEGTRGRRRAYLLVYPLLALAFLIKGPVSVAVFLATAVPYLVLTGGLRRFFREAYPVTGLMVFTAIALPWFAAMVIIHGRDYLAAARTHTAGRFFSTIGGHGGTLLFYVPVLLVTFFPWVVWLPGAARRALRERGEADASEGSEKPLALFAAIWMIGGLIFFSLSQTRMAHYIAPLYPAMAILAALTWDRLLEGGRTGRGTLAFFAALGAVLGGCFLAAPTLLERLRDRFARQIPPDQPLDVTVPFVTIGVLFLAGTALALVFLTRRRIPSAFAASHATILLVFLAILFLAVPRLDGLLLAPSRAMAQEAGLLLGDDGVFIAYGTYRPSLVFYAQRHVLRFGSDQEAEVERILADAPQALILTRPSPDWVPPSSWGRPFRYRGPYLLLAHP